MTSEAREVQDAQKDAAAESAAAEAALAKIGSDVLRQCIDEGTPASTFRKLWQSVC